jgi:hypothetical protein
MVQSINWLDFCEFVVGTVPVPSQMSGSTKRHFQSATSQKMLRFKIRQKPFKLSLCCAVALRRPKIRTMVQSINWLDICEFVVGTVPVPSQMSGSTKRHFQSATITDNVAYQNTSETL